MFIYDRKAGPEQVAPFIGEFARIRQEIVEAGGYPYNDCFIDRIPGIANKEKRGPSVGSHEEAAIYELQCLFRDWEMEARALDLLAQGYEIIEALPAVKRFSHVVLWPIKRFSGEWAEFRDARLIPETKPNQAEYTGAISAVLPKGRRTHGCFVNGRRVLVHA